MRAAIGEKRLRCYYTAGAHTFANLRKQVPLQIEEIADKVVTPDSMTKPPVSSSAR
jgi:hypothetical protein